MHVLQYPQLNSISIPILKDTTGNEPEDLLFANPNHGIIPDESEDDEFDKPLGSDSTS